MAAYHHCMRGGALLALLYGLYGSAYANEALARKNDCFGCHSVANKLVGPAYKDVAAKYAGQDGALEQVKTSIRMGSTGKWGEAPMPPHPQLSEADLKKLATWILGLK